MPLKPLGGGAWRMGMATLLLFFAQASHALCLGSCTCNTSTTPIVFAPYNPLATGTDDSTGNITVSCGGTVGLAIPFTVTLSAGSGSLANRQMASGSQRLAYNLYTTSAYSAIWGDGTSSTVTVSGGFLLDALGIAPSQTLTVYGRIPGGQAAVAPGVYADSVIVTLTYY